MSVLTGEPSVKKKLLSYREPAWHTKTRALFFSVFLPAKIKKSKHSRKNPTVEDEKMKNKLAGCGAVTSALAYSLC